jgi:hypothetical protein
MLNQTNVDPWGDEEPRDEYAEEEAGRVELAIKLNEESSEYECAVCGDKRVSAGGPGLFLADTWDPVCDECGREHAPLLAALIDLGAAAEGYAALTEAPPATFTVADDD